MLIPDRANPDYEHKIIRILEDFDAQYKRFQYSYKIVVGESIEEISRKRCAFLCKKAAQGVEKCGIMTK